MPKMPCLDCGIPTQRSRCISCENIFVENRPQRIRLGRDVRGYDWAWIKVRKQILHRDKYRCGYCGIDIDGADATVDHIVPLSKGGERLDPSNLIAACRSCNSSKKNK